MKAINLPYYNLKLRDISKQLYFQYGWQMPRGLMDSKERSPTNFSLVEWQQAKRLNEDPKVLKKLFQECWAVSDSKKAFSQALEENGFYLARGDRRGFVAVDYRGEVFSLSKWAGVKTKQLKSRLGDPKSLPSVDEVKTQISNKMTHILEAYIKEVHEKIKKQKEPLLQRKQRLRKHHHEHRVALKEKHDERWQKETIERSQRLPRGLKAIWHRITGKYQKIRRKNERETEKCRVRDRDEKQAFIDRQLKERQVLQKEIQHIRNDRKLEILNLRQDIARYMEMSGKSQKIIHEKLDQMEKQQKGTLEKDKDQGYEPEI